MNLAIFLFTFYLCNNMFVIRGDVVLPTTVSCGDTKTFLHCSCKVYNETVLRLLMKCDSLLSPTSNILPDLKYVFVNVKKAYVTWPVIPVSYLNKILKLELSENSINGSIGNLENLVSLRYLNLSYNQLTGLSADLMKLKKLRYLDVSYNKLVVFDFNYFVSADAIMFSALNFLDVSHNIIGSVQSLETLFLNMFVLNELYMSDNQLSALTVNNVNTSRSGMNLQKALAQGYTIPLKVASLCVRKFSSNPITSFDLDFEKISNELGSSSADYQFLALTSISLSSDDSVQIDCDCNLILQLTYLVYNSSIRDSQYYSRLMNSSLARTLKCKYKGNSKLIVDEIINKNQDFSACFSSPTTVLSTAATTTTTSTVSTTFTSIPTTPKSTSTLQQTTASTLYQTTTHMMILTTMIANETKTAAETSGSDAPNETTTITTITQSSTDLTPETADITNASTTATTTSSMAITTETVIVQLSTTMGSTTTTEENNALRPSSKFAFIILFNLVQFVIFYF
jgi:hypothetical protein